MENVQNKQINKDDELFDSIFKSIESIQSGIKKVNAILNENIAMCNRYLDKINKQK